MRSALCCFVGILGASATHAAPATGTSRTVVIRPGSLVAVDPLNFGALISGSTAGTVVIKIDGSRTISGGVTAGGTTFSAARFGGLDVTTPFRVFIHAPTPATVTLTRVGGGATMTVTNLIAELGEGTYTAPANVPFAVRVGGQLNVGANQMQGSYSGTFDLTVDYL